MSTPHIKAKLDDFSETLLMPGDPLRAKYIADHFLENAIQVTSVRNMLGYTGTYQGKRISVMGSGMGIPSMSIYAKELITEYNVKNLIRIGSCGALQSRINMRDIIIAQGASTDSNVNRTRLNGYDFSAIAHYELLEKAVAATKNIARPIYIGNVFSSDLFYHPDQTLNERLIKMNILAIEMEAAGLYGVAAEFNAKALAIMTVSDHITRHEALDADERQSSFNEMVEIALKTATTL